jgi:hypothetical protein
MARALTLEIGKPLAAGSDKVATLGTGKVEGKFSIAVSRMHTVMDQIKEESGLPSSVTMWMYDNSKGGDCDRQLIPNFALKFLYQVKNSTVLDTEIDGLINKDVKNYQSSLLNSIINRLDYQPLYPSKKYDKQGASHKLFMLYQTYIMGHSIGSLLTAQKIAQYVKKHYDGDYGKLGIDLDNTPEKKVTVEQLMVSMVAGGLLGFNEYYDLFVVAHGNPWLLLKFLSAI